MGYKHRINAIRRAHQKTKDIQENELITTCVAVAVAFSSFLISITFLLS
jgi:hypothetical protein